MTKMFTGGCHRPSPQWSHEVKTQYYTAASRQFYDHGLLDELFVQVGEE
jgi:hypothetical protein